MRENILLFMTVILFSAPAHASDANYLFNLFNDDLSRSMSHMNNASRNTGHAAGNSTVNNTFNEPAPAPPSGDTTPESAASRAEAIRETTLPPAQTGYRANYVAPDDSKDENECRQYLQPFLVNGRVQQYVMTACKMPDGKWRTVQ